MVEKKEVNETGDLLGISGFTLGVLSIVLAGPTGIILGIIGMIFCMIQNKKKKTKGSKVGLILNIVGIIVGIAFVITYYFLLAPKINELLQNTAGLA